MLRKAFCPPLKGLLPLWWNSLSLSSSKNMRSRKGRASKTAPGPSNPVVAPQEQDCYEGERLGLLLESVRGKIEAARALDGNVLPEKIWLKQQFAIGVNEVTRLLERMPPSGEKSSSPQGAGAMSSNNKAPQLQAILVASDCNPRWLIRHLPSLASSRKVPLIFVKDKKQGSLRLGEIVKLKTAMAIGIKAKGNAVNDIIKKILFSGEFDQEKDRLELREILGELKQHSFSVQTQNM